MNIQFPFPQMRRSCRQPSSKWKNLYESDEDSQDGKLLVDGKMVALDADWTPTKYIRLQGELKLKDQTMNKISSLNMRLQENILKADSKIESLEADVEKWKNLYHQKSTTGIVFCHIDDTSIILFCT